MTIITMLRKLKTALFGKQEVDCSVTSRYLRPPKLLEYDSNADLLVDGALMHQRVMYLMSLTEVVGRSSGWEWMRRLARAQPGERVQIDNLERYKIKAGDVAKLFPAPKDLPVQSFMIPNAGN